MLTRVISGIVATIIAVATLFFLDTLLLPILVAVVAVLGVYELLLATKIIQSKPLSLIGLVFAFLVPFFSIEPLTEYRTSFLMLFVFALFILLLKMHETVRFEQVGLVFLFATLLPFALNTLVTIRDISFEHSVFYVMLTMMGAWVGDTCAFFVGSFLGKHKLAPQISPKKTIEGAVGGAVCVAIVFVIAGFVYGLISPQLQINYIMLFVLGLLATVFGIMGDLSASIIKRQCAVKDFGSIIPGHGGILDRFDSLIFVAPFMSVAFCIFPIIR